MPLRRCQKDGKKGWAWGHSTCITGPDAREKARKMGIAIELEKQRKGEPSEFDKGSFPLDSMIKEAKAGLDLRARYNKGGENLLVLTLSRKIAEGDFLSHEEISELRKQYNKRARFANANENTMGYINFLLLGGTSTKDFVENERC